MPHETESGQKANPELCIFTVNIPVKILRAPTNLLPAMLRLCRPILRWRFTRQLFEDAVELRQRLETGRERDFAHAKINIEQKNVHLFDALAGDVIDKVFPRHLFELFAQVIGADVHELRDFRQAKLFVRMLLDKPPRFPDFHRLSALSVLETWLPYLVCRRWIFPHATTNRD